MQKIIIACSAVLLMASTAIADDMGSTAPAATCDAVMAQAASASSASTDAAKKAAADNEIKAAQDAKANGDETTCLAHAQSAVDALK